jgi:hypothetical protein
VVEVGIVGLKTTTTWPCWTSRGSCWPASVSRRTWRGWPGCRPCSPGMPRTERRSWSGSRPTVACWWVPWWPDGSRVLKRLLGSGFERLVVTMSSFSNPLAIIDCAARQRYKVVDFAVRTMTFGPYSSEPKVQERIERLASGRVRKAFTSGDRYCLAGVLWARGVQVDLKPSLKAAITSLHR